MDENRILGLIAGGGQLPCMVAKGAKAAVNNVQDGLIPRITPVWRNSRSN